jgi:hypothetical protein
VDAEEFNDWMPPDGEYLVTIVKSSKGISTKLADNPVPWWKLTGRIEAGEDVTEVLGREFSVGFYSAANPGILKSTLNGGDAVPSLADAGALVEAAEGALLRVEVKTSTSKKDQKEYTNCYIKEVVPDDSPVEVAEAPEAPEVAEEAKSKEAKSAK